ncbi:MAG: hypothetical protein WKF63_10365, partial [Thermomicrobiales bacterium]
MPFALEFILNQEKSGRVRMIWREMAERGYVLELSGRPHITMAVWDDLDLVASNAWLQDYAAHLAPFPVRFASTGFFAN